MKISDLKGKKITVMGLGLLGGGVGTVRFLSGAGAQVTVTDIKSKEELKSSLEKLKDLKNITYVLEQHRPENFTLADMIVKNPAAPWSNKYIQMALAKKIPVEMDSSLFFKLCKNPIIGVTGTKGKTTTTTLIYEILKIAGKNPIKVGVGKDSVLDKLASLRKDSIVVFELSSWRLSALRKDKLSPQAAVITNIYSDHLNYYKSMEEYVEDKKNIFLFQKKENACVLNFDNPVTKEFEKELKSRLIKFSKNKIASGQAVYLENGAIYFNSGIDENKIIEAGEIKLRGEHNLENVMAAAAAALSQGINLDIIRKVVKEFSGVPYRLEFVREFGGVKYYNDSAATTPEAAISGINSFSEPVILICGGSDKKLNMAELAKSIINKTKDFVFLKGEATEKILADIRNIRPELASQEFKINDSMEEAVQLAKIHAKAGDVILLSPGAASFGLFVNEFDRGDQFREIVKELI